MLPPIVRSGPRTGRAAASRRGYTLIELIVVITIIAMVAGTVAVSWQSLLPSQRLNAAVRELASRLHGTRSEAISRSMEFRIWYDIDEDRYWVEMPTPEAERRRTGTNLEFEEFEENEVLRLFETDLKDGVEFSRITIDGEDYDDGIVFVRFDPLGASSEHTILLHQEQFDRYFTIEVLPLTGLIKFHDGDYVREEAEDADFD